MSKPKVGFYWCASCGGCEESVVDLAEGLLDVVAAVDLVFFPVAMDFKREDVEAMADGEMAPEERKVIMTRLEESGLGEEQRRQVREDLELPATPGELAGMVSEDAERELLYRFAALVAMADRDMAELERSWLDKLAGSLGLSDDGRRVLEQDLFG